MLKYQPLEEPGQSVNQEDLAGQCVAGTHDELPSAGWRCRMRERRRLTTPDIIFYFRKDVLAAVSEAGRAASCCSRLIHQDWVMASQLDWTSGYDQNFFAGKIFLFNNKFVVILGKTNVCIFYLFILRGQ